MDAATFRDELAGSMETELNRLGSQKLLIALTDARLDGDTVLAAAATDLKSAAETYEVWAGTESNGAAHDTFTDIADRLVDRYESIFTRLDDYEPPGPLLVDLELRSYGDTTERVAGGLVARSLVAIRTYTQVVSFFINEADRELTDFFREVKESHEADVASGTTLLEETCTTEDEWERARVTAEGVIRLVYDEYVETLDGMGLDPKPVC